MSQQACAEFFTKINTDAALQQEVGAALEGKEDMAAATALAEVGAKHGYEFTVIEADQKYKDQYQEIIIAADGELYDRGSSMEGELDDRELQSVAGGHNKVF